jgi:bifunctional non-homologous end joining protein LigD
MLPHVANRPLTLVRCPDGVGKECFYQRHLGMGASPGDLKMFDRLRSSKGKYLYLDSKNGILSAVQNGAIEFHTWGASVPDPKRPDRITMDLDPAPDVKWADLVQATRLTRTLLEKLGLKCFLKTTGGKGLHVVAPLEPKLPWDEVKEFTRLVAEFLVRAEPGLFIANMSKAKRTGKVFADYLRNSETASAVSAYSARAREEAGVSTPLDWDELGKADIRGKFTVLSVPKRLASLTLDPWAEYWSTRQSITAAMWNALRAKA